MASAKASTTEKFNCTCEELFKIITDYESYPEFLPELKDVKVLKKTKDKKLMEYHVSLIKTFKYQLEAKEKKNETVQFHYTEGDVFKSMSGQWTLKESGKGKCTANYEVEASFGLLVPSALAKTLVSVNLPSMMANFKKRVKEVYGK